MEDIRHLIDTHNPINFSHQLNKNLLHWWMNIPGLDGGRYLYDLRGNVHADLGNVSSHSVWKPTSRAGGFGQLNFNGGLNYAVVPSGPGVQFNSNPKTLTAWVYDVTGSSSGTTAIIAKDGSTLREWVLLFSNKKFIFITFNTDNTITQLEIFDQYNPGQWNFVVCGHDPYYARSFIRINNSGRIYSAVHSPAKSGSQSVSIGSSLYYSSNPLYIDDIRIYDKVLSEEELNYYYQLSMSGYRGLINKTLTYSGLTSRSAYINIGISKLSKTINVRNISAVLPPIYSGFSNLSIDYNFYNTVFYYPSITGHANLSKSVNVDLVGYIDIPVFSGQANLTKVVRLTSDNFELFFSGKSNLEIRPVLIARGKSYVEGFVYDGVLYITDETIGDIYLTDEVIL